MFEDVEDRVDSWVSVGIVGALTAVLGMMVLVWLSRLVSPQTLGAQVVALGFLELVFGTFAMYVVRPSAMVAVATASALTIVVGVSIAASGAALSWDVGLASLTFGLGCAVLGTMQGVRTWSNLYRKDVSAG